MSVLKIFESPYMQKTKLRYF